ncbi:lasso peptide biosynthesis protein [Streptomyces sp. NPDC003006]
MPLIQLAEQTVFDPADGTGVLLDTAEGVYFQLNPTVVRLFDPDALCLTRSSALAVHLSALGVPAETVIARQRSPIGAPFACHSWTELHDEVLNDVPAAVQSGHTVLQRVGCPPLSEPVPRLHAAWLTSEPENPSARA